MKQYRVLVFLVLVAVLGSALAGCTPATPAPTQAPQQPAATTAPPQPAATSAPAQPAATTAPEPAASSGTLVIAMNIDDGVTLDPAVAGETINIFVFNNTYDRLVEIRPDDLTKVVGMLAETWEVSPDGVVYTFHLRPNVKFASGNPVTAEDVKFTFDRLKNIKAAASFNVDQVKMVEVVDPLTAKVTLLGPSASFLAIAANPSMGIEDSKLAMEHGATSAEDADTTDKAKEWFDQNSAGSGPYVQTSWVPKSEIVFEANPNYWKGTPKFAKVIIKHVSDPTTALQMLQKGDADIVPYLDYDLVETAKADPNLTVIVNQTLDQNYLAMTSDPAISKPLSEKLVRQAVAAAIDYDGIINAVLRGYGARAPSIVPLGVLGVDPAMTQGRDLDKAKSLLKDAGYETGFDVNLHYGSNPVRETIAAKIKSDLAEAGINVTLVPMEQSVYLTEMRAQKLPFCFGGWTPDFLDPTIWTDYFSRIDQGIAMRMKYDNPKAVEVSKVIDTELDAAKRADAVKELQQILMEDMPFTMIYQNQAISAMTKDLKGFAYHPVYIINLFDLSK